MDDGNSWIGIVLFAASVILFAVMYGFGAAVQALNTSALEDERDEGNKRAEKLLKIQEDPYLFIRTNQLATSILTLAMGASSLAFVVKKLTALIGTHTQIPYPAAVGIAYIAGLVGIAFLLTGLGIVIPKRIAAKSPIRFCYKVLPLVELVTKCLFPFAWLMDQFAYISLKAVGIDIREKDDNVTEEDIMYMVNEGHEQGVLEASEAEMITNIFEFDDKVAADIMTHRTAVIALDGEMTLKEALDFVVKEANYSRFPVYSEDIDNIIGIVYAKDMLRCINETAEQMAVGVANALGSDIGVGITGIAGPGGGTEDKPTGLVYISVWYDGKFFTRKMQSSLGRDRVRMQAASTALDLIRRHIF